MSDEVFPLAEPVSAFTALQRLFRVFADRQRAALERPGVGAGDEESRGASLAWAEAMVLVREAMESAEAFDALADDVAEGER